MEFLSNLQRQEFLADIATGSFNTKKETKKEMEIEVDPNHKPSADAMFGYKLSQDPIAWNKYFNQ